MICETCGAKLHLCGYCGEIVRGDSGEARWWDDGDIVRPFCDQRHLDLGMNRIMADWEDLSEHRTDPRPGAEEIAAMLKADSDAEAAETARAAKRRLAKLIDEYPEDAAAMLAEGTRTQ